MEEQGNDNTDAGIPTPEELQRRQKIREAKKLWWADPANHQKRCHPPEVRQKMSRLLKLRWKKMTTWKEEAGNEAYSLSEGAVSTPVGRITYIVQFRDPPPALRGPPRSGGQHPSGQPGPAVARVVHGVILPGAQAMRGFASWKID